MTRFLQLPDNGASDKAGVPSDENPGILIQAIILSLIEG